MSKNRDMYRATFLICILLGILFLTIINVTYINDNPEQTNEEGNIFSDWYTIENGKKIYVNQSSGILAEGGEFILYNTLPECSLGESLFIRTYHQNIEVKIGDRLVYSYGNDLRLRYSDSSGAGFHIIALETSDSYKDISIAYKSAYISDNYEIFDTYIGRESTVVFNFISENIVGIIANLLITTLGVILIIIAIIFGRQLKTKLSLYLGVLACLFSVWSMIQIEIVQLFFNNNIFLMYFNYVTFMLIPMSIILFVREALRIYSDKGLKLLLILFNSVFTLSIIFELFGVVQIKEMLKLTHILILFGVVYIVYVTFKYYKRFKKNNLILISKVLTLILGLFVVVDIYRYYSITSCDLSKYTRIGLLILIVVLTVYYVKDYYERTQEYAEARILARLAYKDVMTGLYNRTAYAEDIAIYEKQLIVAPDTLKFIFVIFDLNNLKTMNDFHGHCVGDYYIVKTGKIIKKAFEKIGKCYRIGGDEFAVIITNKNYSDYEKAVREMTKLIDEENGNADLEYSIAYGCAEFVSGEYNSIDEIIEVADKNMYRNKEDYKEHILTLAQCNN